MNRATDNPNQIRLREGLDSRGAAAVQRRDFRRDGRSHASQTRSRALQHRGRRRTAARASRSSVSRGATKSDDEFRKEMEEAARKFSRQTVRDEIWKGFAQSIFYHRERIWRRSGYKSLAERLDKNRQGARHARQSPFLSRGRPGAVRDHPQKSESSRAEQERKEKAGRASSWKNRSAPISTRRAN